MGKLATGAASVLLFGLVALVGLIVLAGTHNLTDPTVRDTLTGLALAALTGGGIIHGATNAAGAVAANVTTPVAPADPTLDNPQLSAGDVQPSQP